MKSLEESVSNAMDIFNPNLLPHLPYILQDFWEIGADPHTIISLIKKHTLNPETLNLLDLGCGKGAVSVKTAEALGITCLGIDAIPEFIQYANNMTLKYKVTSLCKFEVADIREKILTLRNFDIIILGAIGPVFGNYYETMTLLKNALNPNGLILIDDGYLNDNSKIFNPQLLRKSELLSQINKAGMILIDEVIAREDNKVIENYDTEFQNLKRRCLELAEKHPDKSELFLDYIKIQNEEYENLKTEIICSTMAFRPL